MEQRFGEWRGCWPRGEREPSELGLWEGRWDREKQPRPPGLGCDMDLKGLAMLVFAVASPGLG